MNLSSSASHSLLGGKNVTLFCHTQSVLMWTGSQLCHVAPQTAGSHFSRLSRTFHHQAQVQLIYVLQPTQTSCTQPTLEALPVSHQCCLDTHCKLRKCMINLPAKMLFCLWLPRNFLLLLCVTDHISGNY